jgi:pimeloyl-ACP methyl ester carboxylesterase
MNIRKITGYVFASVLVWIMLSQCLIMRNRWSDQKALRVFKAKHVPLSIHDTVINGRHIHYAVSGSIGLPVLVFVHGSPGSWMNYMHCMWDTALQQKFRMVSIDRPGFGYSDFGSAMHLQQQCELILPVLRSIKTTQPMYLCGHSLGGPAAVQLAASDTALFTGIVIASGALDIGLEKQETWRKIMNVKPFYWALPGAFGPSNTELLYLKKDLLPLQDEFKKITCKVHFIHGTDDDWVPIQNIAYGVKMMVNAESITADTIPGAGHMIPWNNEKVFTDMLLRLY